MAWTNYALLAFLIDAGYALSSYSITYSISNGPISETKRNDWKTMSGSMLFSGATITAYELLRVFGLSIHLKAKNIHVVQTVYAMRDFTITRTLAH